MKAYIILSAEHDFGVVGPFHTLLDAVSWAELWQYEHGDDPRWQSVELTDEQIEAFRATPVRKP